MGQMNVSKRAQITLQKIREGKFYRWEPHPRAVIQELLDAKLITTMGRVESIVLCYVPRGTKPLKLERFPEKREKVE